MLSKLFPNHIWVSVGLAAMSAAAAWGGISSSAADQKVFNTSIDARVRAVEQNSAATAQALRDIHDDLRNLHQDLEKK